MVQPDITPNIGIRTISNNGLVLQPIPARDRNNLFSSGPAQRKRLKILSMHFIVRLGNSKADVQNSWRPVRTDLISSNLPLYERVFAFHPMAWILSNRGWQCACKGDSYRAKRNTIQRYFWGVSNSQPQDTRDKSTVQAFS